MMEPINIKGRVKEIYSHTKSFFLIETEEEIHLPHCKHTDISLKFLAEVVGLVFKARICTTVDEAPNVYTIRVDQQLDFLSEGLEIEIGLIETPEMLEVVGNKFDTDKIRYDLLPIEALEEVSKVLTFGAKKYGDRNWENGINYSRLFRAAVGHVFDWWRGKDNDEETGLSHLAHAGCCILFLLTFVKRNKTEFDDRVKEKV